MMRNKLTGLNAALVLVELGDKKAKEVFDYYRLKSVGVAKSKVAYLERQLVIELQKIEKDTQEDVKYNLFRDVAQMEQILERSIDIDKATVSYWIELNKLAKQIIKSRKK